LPALSTAAQKIDVGHEIEVKAFPGSIAFGPDQDISPAAANPGVETVTTRAVAATKNVVTATRMILLRRTARNPVDERRDRDDIEPPAITFRCNWLGPEPTLTA
jgi:hypothetical protein